MCIRERGKTQKGEKSIIVALGRKVIFFHSAKHFRLLKEPDIDCFKHLI